VGRKLVTSGKDTGATAVRLSGQSKGQCSIQVRSSSFCPMTSTILAFLRLGVSGIFLVLLMREKNPPFYLVSNSARKYHPLSEVRLLFNASCSRQSAETSRTHARQLPCHITHIFECVLIDQVQHRITATSQRTQDNITLQDDN
jgi:hypothetical protein